MMAEEEWERPIGLTKEWAICVDDSDDDGGDIRGKANTTCTANGPISSYFRSDADASKSESSDGGHRTKDSEATTTNEYTSDENVDNSGSLISNSDSLGRDVQPASDNGKIGTKRNGTGNPFASFAFNAGEAASSSSSWRPAKLPRVDASTSKRPFAPQTKKNVARTGEKNSKNTLTMQAHSFFAKKAPSNAKLETANAQQKKKTDKAETREELIAKWHAFADPDAPIEQQRFQVLVAARIHARCQEKVVLKAMDRLRKHFDEKGDTCCNTEEGSGDKTRLVSTQQQLACSTPSAQPQLQGLTVHALAKGNPETEIAPLLSSVLFGNTKANQIVQAAQDVISKFGGDVPESQCSLKEITGIGPKLAEILSIVNRRGTYA